MKVTLNIPQAIIEALRGGTDLEVSLTLDGGVTIEPPAPSPTPVVDTIIWLSANNMGPEPVVGISNYVGGPTYYTPSSLPAGTRHLYSRQSALAGDGSFALLHQPDGHFVVWNLTDHSLRAIAPSTGLAGGNCDANVLGHMIYCVGQNGFLVGFNIVDWKGDVVNGPRLSYCPPGVTYAHSGAEGRPSNDWRYFPFMLFDAGFTCVGYGAWNGTANTWGILLENRGLKPNHVTMSPSGKYFIVSRIDTGANRGNDPLVHAGTWAHPVDGGKAFRMTHGSQHSDVCVGKDGRDYFIYADFDSLSPEAGTVWYAPIEDIQNRTLVIDTYGPNHEKQNNAFHFSGCGPDGWVLASAYGRAPAPGSRVAWWDNRIFAVEIGGASRVALLAEHGSVYTGDYWQEPHACWSRDGSKAIFASNDGKATGPISAYVIDLPKLP